MKVLIAWFFVFYYWGVDGYNREKNGKKYLIIASTDKNEEVLTKYTDDKPGEYDEKYMKIKLNSNDNFALNKLLKPHNLRIFIRSHFQKENKCYP